MAKKRTRTLSQELAPLVKKKREDDQIKGILDAVARYNAFQERYENWESQFKKRYVETENPLVLWDCYFFARIIGEPVPEFVFEYLDRAAYNLLNLENNLNKVGCCLELNLKKTNKGGHSAFRQYADYLERRQVVFDVYQMLENHPDEMSVKDACYKVATEHTLPFDGETVFKWYRTIKL